MFNRSYYEEVLVVRVHPQFLDAQRLPDKPSKRFWKERFRAIAEHERHLAEEGTIILKFWLNISKDEQRKRLLERIDDPSKHWKFNAGDLDERALWDDYLDAYQDCLEATSKPWAPWYAIPADDKPLRPLAGRQTDQRHVRAARSRVSESDGRRPRGDQGGPPAPAFRVDYPVLPTTSHRAIPGPG